MDLIPVIDLQAGRVVRAVRGERATYLPLVSPLAPDGDAVALARAMCERAASRRLYIADLDAITQGRPQWPAIDALLAALPELELWLDAGFADPETAATACTRWTGRITPVYGSESLRARTLPADAVLSLDLRHGAPLDPAGWWQRPEHWPRTLIVMTLDAVGADSGPDFATLRSVRERAPAGTHLVGAGGVRDAHDLAAAAMVGADAWLVASALHAGRVGRQGRVAAA